jgi:preprotein translocase subunit SecY
MDTAINIIVVTASSIFLMWLGELITEFGVGNGLSLIIFSGIVAALPGAVSQLYISFDPGLMPVYLAFLTAGLLVIWGVVIITEAERPIPVTYAKQVRGGKMYGGVSTYLPLRVNQAGVIPIIFAISLILFPQMIANFLLQVNNAIIHNIAQFIVNVLANQWIYASIYFVLVFLFTYFYTAITFDPDSISKNLQRSGAFIPGIRPGTSTSEYLSKATTRLTLLGALFLGIIAVLPLITGTLTGIQSLALGGTGLLIVVSVVIDLIKKMDAQISAREY